MSDQPIIDMTKEIQNGSFVVLNPAGLEDADVRAFAILIRPFAQLGQNQICVPLFESERSNCQAKVWAVFATLSQRGQFRKLQAQSYAELFAELEKTQKKIFVIVKNEQERSRIAQTNASGAKLIFCKLLQDGKVLSMGYAAENHTRAVPQGGAGQGARSDAHHEAGRDNRSDPRREFKPRDYQIATKPSIQGIHRLVVRVPAQEGCLLCDSKGNGYRLTRKKLRNNGAYTYETDHNGMWAKIYDDSYNSSFFEDKIHRMLKNPVKIKGVIWPQDVLVDSTGVFRGYLMSSFSGEPLQTSVLKRDGQEQFFPNWKKEDLCTLTLTILDKIKSLHQKGVLMGCINPAAIRVVSQNEVYFCDTDDYQIEGYLTLSHNISFAAPENLDKKLYLTSLDSEKFSVAELVFMLMMTGKTPYLSGNSRVIETIKRMHFPFYVNDYDERNPNVRVMPSSWRYMWSHLSFELKKAFSATFQKNMYYNAQGKRLPAFKWYEMVERYRNGLLKEPPTSDSHNLYPTTFRKKEGDIFYRCSICGKEHPKFFFDRNYFEEFHVCNACMDLPSRVSYKCVNCGRTFIYKNRTALYHQRMRENNSDWRDQRHCPECKAKKETCSVCGKSFPFYEITNGMCRTCRTNWEQQPYETRRCACGRSFTITRREKAFYDSKGFSLPKKCEICRKNKNR